MINDFTGENANTSLVCNEIMINDFTGENANTSLVCNEKQLSIICCK